MAFIGTPYWLIASRHATIVNISLFWVTASWPIYWPQNIKVVRHLLRFALTPMASFSCASLVRSFRDFRGEIKPLKMNDRSPNLMIISSVEKSGGRICMGFLWLLTRPKNSSGLRRQQTKFTPFIESVMLVFHQRKGFRRFRDRQKI